MNPGTTLFIIIGIIGLMLYALQALKISSNSLKEGFSDTLNLNTLNDGDMNALAKALGFPDSDIINPLTNSNTQAMPNPSMPNEMPNEMPMHNPSMPMHNPMPISNGTNGRPQTISDFQGIVAVENHEKEIKKLKKSMINAMDNKVDDNKNKKRKKKNKCPPMPDMSLYIRKDQIPCWGCDLK